MAVTCATPGTDSRRGRSVQSASVRSSSGERPLLLTIPTSMISPINDEIGPMVGTTPSGRCPAAELQPFGDDLTVDVDVGVPVELHEQEGETSRRCGTDPLHVGRAVHQRFERQRDQALDFLGRQTGSLREDRDDRAVQIRKDVDVQARDDQQTRTPGSVRRARRRAADWRGRTG